MKYLKLFEEFEVESASKKLNLIDTLKTILDCVKSKKRLSDNLDGSEIMDLHDSIEIEDIQNVLLKASEVISKESEGRTVNLEDVEEFDIETIESLIDVQESERESLNESNFNKTITISEEEMNLFSQEPALQKLITDNKIKLMNAEVSFDEDDKETRYLLDQYLEMPGTIE